MESILEVVDLSKMGVFVFWVIIPVFLVAKSYLSKCFFSATEFTYLIISILAISWYEGAAFGAVYLAVLFIYTIWWSREFSKYREENPGEYEEYRKYYSEYYGDDLNQDGIKDAFEHWEIAHDPRFFWLFGSKMAKRERKLKREKEQFYAKAGFNSEQYFKSGYHGDKSKDYSDGAGSSFTKGTYKGTQGSRTNNGGNGYSQNYRSNANSYSQSSRNNANGYAQSNYEDPHMSEAEKEVAKQHAFAKRHNLRYFSMCTSKAEAKKLYRKYAAKFHPDNSVTGDKDKFIAIDEEYNRFCAIDEVS